MERDEHAARVLEVLTGSRLVTVGEGTAEVAHEALLREWPRLRGWLEEDAEGRRLHRHLTLAAQDWEAGGPGRRRAVPGRSALTAPSTGRRSTGEELNRLEREFLESSRLASRARGRAQPPGQPPPASAAGRRGCGPCGRDRRRRRWRSTSAATPATPR